jgi:cytochrome P450
MDDGLSRILAAKAEDGTTIGDREAVMELHHVDIAGYIVFAELTTMLVELDAHPQVRDRLRAEIRAHAASGPLTLEQLAGMQYLGQVVKEVKRVAPILPVIFGKAREDFVHAGYRVPKGWMVFWGLRATNTYKETFADAERFDPDRFSSARAEDTKHPHGFVPQGAGPEMGHKCPGTDYATLFMQVFATVLLRGTTWELAPGQDLSLDWSKIPPEQKDGLRVTFRAG